MKASIIIPTCNRLSSLRELLGSLDRQPWEEARFEVILVDDGSTDDTPQVAQERFSFPLRCYAQDNQGGFAARNQGAKYAQSDVLIFVDDDMSLEPGFVAAMVSEVETHPHTIALATFLPYLTPQDTPFKQLYAHLTATPGPAAAHDFSSFTECVSNAMATRRHLFFEIGPFRDVVGRGPGLWGDIEFGYRAHQYGVRFRRSAVARCYHRDHTIASLDTHCRRMEQIAELAVLLFRTHPEVCEHLPMFDDMARIAWRADKPALIVRKALRHATSQPAALSTLRWLARKLETCAPRSRSLAAVYRWSAGGHIWRGFRRGLAAGTPITAGDA